MSEDKANTSPEQHISGRRRLRRRLLLLGPAIIILLSGYFYLTGGRYVETENAYLKASKVAISAEVEGPITQVAVAENTHVKKGDVLFTLDPRPFQIALDRAEAELKNVRAEVEGLIATYKEKEDELALAIEDRNYARREYDRQVGLTKHNVSSQTRLEQAKHGLISAKQHVVTTRQALARLRAKLGGDPALPVEQQPLLQQARASRDQAALDLEHATVRAPIDGVASKTPERGQYINTGQPVMSLVSDSDIWIEANFKETQLGGVRPGQPVEITIDTYPGKTWHGTVESISQATGAEFSVLPAQNSTGNWVKVVQRIPVRIRIERRQDGLPLRAGVSTEVEIDTGYSHLAQLLGSDTSVAAKGK
jgi:membrane fusion protein (multidrug efflux system)